MARGSRGSVLLALAILALWEVAGRLGWVAGGTLPAPSRVLIRFLAEAPDYGPHVLATVETAAYGFALGNLVAILAAVLFALWPPAERLARGINIAVFAVPPIAIVPVLVIALDGTWPRIALAALMVYFPTMTATLAGLREHDRRAADVIAAYGGGRWKTLRLLQLRAALPAIMGGLKVAAPAAVLGAVLAEFGSGARWGLGTFLLGSMGRADPERLWGIGLTATAIAGACYAAAAFAAQRATRVSRSVTLAPDALAAGPARESAGRRLLFTLAAVAVPLLAWQGLLWAGGLSPIIAKSPWGVVEYLFLSPSSPAAQARLFQALAETVPITLLGILAGLAAAFGLALLSFLAPLVMRAVLPFALVTQTMPLVALTPLAVLLFGRGLAVTMVITTSVTFFAAFVILAQGFQLISRAAFDLVDAYGAGPLTRLRLVVLPASRAWLFVAMRLAVPKALLGVMIAEWMATGRGLGNLLNQSRGYLDYGMIWTVAVVSILLATALYQLTYALERLLTRRRT